MPEEDDFGILWIKRRPLWVLLTPAEDIPGAWIAHNLDWDVVTQGHSIEHSMEMILEASLLSDQDDGFSKISAPAEEWKKLKATLKCKNMLLDPLGEKNYACRFG